MKNPAVLFGALGLGAGLMYFLDPERGRRRRALARDRARHLSRAANREMGKNVTDLRNRAQGIWFEAEKIFEKDEITDEKLEGRIRAKLGRLTSHPHAIKTNVENGKVILSGIILKDEAEILRRGIADICGVKEIETRLESYESPEHISSLQGKNRVRDTILKRQNENWEPSARIIAAALGGGLAIMGARKGNTVSSLLASAGVGLLARSAINKPLASILPGTGNGPIKINKTINIDAPRERVFEVLKYPQYFPNFMSHVRRVEPMGERRFLWSVDGIGGYPVEWETEVTDIWEDSLIKWKNAGDKRNGQAGFLRLEKAGEGATRLHVEMNYNPIGGKFGHTIARLFSRDPKSELDDDLLRLKAYIEKGKIPRDAAANINSKRRKEMKVREIMTKNPAFCTPETNLRDVAKMMIDCDCGCIPVTENAEVKKPIGMITDRDITLRSLGNNKNPLDMTAGEIMTFNAVSVTPDMSVEDCVAAMEKNQIRRLAVVDESGELCGMVAQADIARCAPPFETAELVKDVSMQIAA